MALTVHQLGVVVLNAGSLEEALHVGDAGGFVPRVRGGSARPVGAPVHGL